MKELSRRDFLKGIGALTALIMLVNYKRFPQVTAPIATESSPKNEEVEMNTAVTVTVGNMRSTYYGFSSLTVSNNAFAMGENISNTSSRKVYKEVDGMVGGPISSVKFAYSNPELCNFKVEKGEFKLQPMPIESIWEKQVPFVKGLLTVFDRKDNNEIIKKRFLIANSTPFEINEFRNNGVSIPKAWQILENGQVIKASNNGGLKFLLTRGLGDGTIAYLLENFSSSVSIPNNMV